MAADIFTKFFVSADPWRHAIRLLGFMRKASTARFCAPIIPSVRGTVDDVDDPSGHPLSGESAGTPHDAPNTEILTTCSSDPQITADCDFSLMD